MSQPFLITIDQGTTGSRVFLINKKAKVLASSYKEFTQYFPKAGWVEHDPNEIWMGIKDLIADVFTKSNLNPKNAIGIGITNQRETTVLWNNKTKETIHNAIVWQCKRTANICNQLKTQGHSEVFRKKTGLVIDAYFSGTKIKWLLDHLPHLKSDLDAGHISFGTIDSFLLYKLTGEHKTDYTNASRTLIYNIHEKKWDEELLKILNIPVSILPEVQNTASLFGKTKNMDVLPDGIPIYSLVGDQQSALFGQLCFAQGDVKNTYGTGCFMLMNTGEKALESKHGLITTIACNEKGEPNYALEGSIFIGGAVIQFLRDNFHFFKDALETDALVESIANKEDDIVFIPAFSGLGAPYWNQEVKGAILGLTRDSNINQITRAALKSIALQSRDLLQAMIKDSHLDIKKLKVDGGATANNYLMGYQASILNRPILIPQNKETTVLGAAYLAGIASGFWSTIDDLKNLNPLSQTFEPSMLSQEEVKHEINKWDLAINQISKNEIH